MDQNSPLDDDELADGYVLTCQPHSISDEVVLDYGRRTLPKNLVLAYRYWRICRARLLATPRWHLVDH